MRQIKWTLRMKFWQKVHHYLNILAWKFAPNSDKTGDASDDTHWLWKINNWASDHYIPWYLEQVTGKKYPKEKK